MADKVLQKTYKTLDYQVWLNAVDWNLMQYNLEALQIHVLAYLVLVIHQGSNKQDSEFAQTLLRSCRGPCFIFYQSFGYLVV